MKSSNQVLQDQMKKVHEAVDEDSHVVALMRERDPEGIVRMDDYWEDNYGGRPYGTERRKES